MTNKETQVLAACKLLIKHFTFKKTCKREHFSPSCPECQWLLLKSMLQEYVDIQEWYGKKAEVQKGTYKTKKK